MLLAVKKVYWMNFSDIFVSLFLASLIMFILNTLERRT